MTSLSSPLFLSTHEFVELLQNHALGSIVDLLLANKEGEAECLSRTGPQLGQLSVSILAPKSVLLTTSLFFPDLAIWSMIYADISLIV